MSAFYEPALGYVLWFYRLVCLSLLFSVCVCVSFFLSVCLFVLGYVA